MKRVWPKVDKKQDAKSLLSLIGFGLDENFWLFLIGRRWLLLQRENSDVWTGRRDKCTDRGDRQTGRETQKEILKRYWSKCPRTHAKKLN